MNAVETVAVRALLEAYVVKLREETGCAPMHPYDDVYFNVLDLLPKTNPPQANVAGNVA